MPPIFIAIQNATLAARARLGDEAISVPVEAGKGRIGRTTFDADGTSDFVPLTEWMPVCDVPAALDAL